MLVEFDPLSTLVNWIACLYIDVAIVRKVSQGTKTLFQIYLFFQKKNRVDSV